MDKEETAKAAAEENPQAPIEELSEPTVAEVDGEAARKKKRKVVIAAVVALAALLLVGAGAAQAMSNASGRPADKQTVAVGEKKSEEAKSEVRLTLKAEGAGDAAAPAKVKVTRDGKDVVGEREVECNKAVNLGELEKGDYELVVTSAPVLEDGSTYKLPEAPAEVSVDGEGKAVEIECALSRVAKEEMSKEQLEAAASALEAAGKADSAASVAQAAQSAPSVPGDENSAKQGVPEPSTPSGPVSNTGGSDGGSGSANDGPDNGGGQPGPSEPQHVHDYSIPNYVNGDPIIESHYYCSICGEIPEASYAGHKKPHALAGESASTWVDEFDVGYEQLLTGYSCSCGAFKPQ